MRFTSRLAATLTAATIVSGAAAVLAASPASAATCSGHGCDNLDPHQTGCDSSTTVAGQVPTPYGTFNLIWSPGCQTNWLMVPDLHNVSWLDLDVQTYEGHADWQVNSPSAGRHWGNMHFAPNCAIGTINLNDSSGGGHYYEVHSHGC